MMIPNILSVFISFPLHIIQWSITQQFAFSLLQYKLLLLIILKALPDITTRECPCFNSIQFSIWFYFCIVLYCYNRMYCTFRNAKCFGGLSYGCVVFDDIIRYMNCPFLNIIFQRKSLRTLFYILWNAPRGYDHFQFHIIWLFSYNFGWFYEIWFSW